MIERDPTGLDAHQLGAKLDAGKPRPMLVLGGFSRALMAVSEVGTFGAAKYTENGWRHVANGEARYSDALLRHLFAEAAGEVCDSDSGLLHAAHCAWNALARLELALMAASGCAARAVDLDKAIADAAQALGFDKPAVDGLGEAVLFDAAGARVAWPADDRYQWFAVDASGRGWFYRCEKPVICRDSWSSSVGGFLPVEDRRFLGCNWQDSLRVRYPQEVAVHG